jgi:hypothetical protein
VSLCVILSYVFFAYVNVDIGFLNVIIFVVLILCKRDYLSN